MKKHLLLSLIMLIAISFSAQGQIYTTDVPYHMAFDSSYVVGQGVIDSFDIGSKQGYVSGQFVLCHNATLTFKGNQSSSGPSFYLYPGSTLILQDSYFYPTIYMMEMSTVDAKGGNQNVICRREGTATLTDTANVNWIKDSTYTGMSFTFSTWPNGISPCPIVAPQGVDDLTVLEANVYMQNRSLNYSLNNEQAAHFLLYDVHGRNLLRKEIANVGQIDLSHLAGGIYIVHIEQKGKLRKQKIFLD